MEQDLVKTQLGKETDLEVKLDGGNLVLSLNYHGLGGGATVSVSVAPDYFLDKLAVLIPGKLDDKLIAFLKLALKD